MPVHEAFTGRFRARVAFSNMDQWSRHHPGPEGLVIVAAARNDLELVLDAALARACSIAFGEQRATHCFVLAWVESG
jgi:hypothetical protein